MSGDTHLLWEDAWDRILRTALLMKMYPLKNSSACIPGTNIFVYVRLCAGTCLYGKIHQSPFILSEGDAGVRIPGQSIVVQLNLSNLIPLTSPADGISHRRNAAYNL